VAGYPPRGEAAHQTLSPVHVRTAALRSVRLLWTAAANSGTLEGSVCALPFGVTTAPNNYSATIAVSKAGNEPLAINASGGTDLGPGTVGQPFAQNFFLSGGAAPYTWSLASGQLPPGLTLQTFASPRDASDELAGTPTKAGTYTFTMRLTDYPGQQATQQFTLVINP
jgi:hypothetical protein